MTREELLNCLTGRPCSVCTFKKENGCSKWNCVFEKKTDDICEEEKKKLNAIAFDLLSEVEGYEQAIDDIKAEIKEWYWQVDKRALAKDPCIVDAMVDLFIRTINKYLADMRGNNNV